MRFTPTCVGNANAKDAHHRFPPVHPHVCGECLFSAGTSTSPCGSPPRVWGMLHMNGWRIVGLRFTPTCVGNAAAAPPRAPRCTVHPHVCGECRRESIEHAPCLGSPPRVWGMRPRRSRPPWGSRFTPTCVGNAEGTQARLHRGSVHPHVCGECRRAGPAWWACHGSPPRVWGMQHAAFEPRFQPRFTPTCVGNARRSKLNPFFPSVHPHVCGECIWSPT